MDVRSGVFDDFVVFDLCVRTRDRENFIVKSSAFPASNTQKITPQMITSSSGRSYTRYQVLRFASTELPCPPDPFLEF
jgi:hypothetical protein